MENSCGARHSDYNVISYHMGYYLIDSFLKTISMTQVEDKIIYPTTKINRKVVVEVFRVLQSRLTIVCGLVCAWYVTTSLQ